MTYWEHKGVKIMDKKNINKMTKAFKTMGLVASLIGITMILLRIFLIKEVVLLVIGIVLVVFGIYAYYAGVRGYESALDIYLANEKARAKAGAKGIKEGLDEEEK